MILQEETSLDRGLVVLSIRVVLIGLMSVFKQKLQNAPVSLSIKDQMH